MATSSKIAGIFDLGDGEHFVVAEWHPDPEKIEADLITMASKFEDWSVPLEEARQLMIENTKILFEEERDPTWRPWTPLEAEYGREKSLAGKIDKILQREGDLYDAATSEEAWLVTDDAIMFDAGALPLKDGVNYGAINQAGSGAPGTTVFHHLFRTMTVDELHKLRRSNPKVDKFLDAFQTKEGSGNNLPARPFIGATAGTIADIEAVFLKHLQNTVIDPWDEMGGTGGITDTPQIGDLGSYSGGTFPIIGFTKRGQPMLRTPHGVRFGRMPR